MSFIKPGRPKRFNALTGEGHKPPHKQGWYRIRNALGEIVYDGKGWLDDCKNRHVRTGKLASKRKGK